MADFSPEDYFTRRLKKDTSGHDWVAEPSSSKHAEVMRATEEKLANLQAIGEARKLDEQTWVNKLGLDNSSALGQTVNLGASMYQGASRVAGDVAGFVAGDLPAMYNDAQLQEHEVAAINRYKQGIATPEDIELINSKQVRYEKGGALNRSQMTDAERADAKYRAEQDRNASTPLELFERATEARLRSSRINESFDRGNLVRSDRKDVLLDDVGSDFQAAWDQTGLGNMFDKDKEIGGAKDVVTGLAKLVYNAGKAGVTNPGGSAEYVAENLPQLLIGGSKKFGKEALTLSNAGYASENYQKGIEKYQAENNGALPPEAQRREMALWAASTAVAEHVTDTKLLDTIKGAGKAVKEAGEDAVRSGLKESLKNIGKAGLVGTAGEALTEGYQTYAEAQASLEDVTAKDVYVGATIGGIAGGGMTAGGRAAYEAVKENPEKAAKREQEAKDAAAIEAAIASNDPSVFLDPESKTYSPSKAVAVLHGNSKLPTATPETQAANLDQANQIIAELDDKLQAEWDDLFTKEDAGELDKPAIQARKIELGKMEKELTEARKLKDDLVASSTPVADIKAKVQLASAPVDVADKVAVEASRTAAEEVINLSMQSPLSVTEKEALAMADNASNGLSDIQRNYLRQFSESQIASNALQTRSKTSQEIYHGSPAGSGRNNIGIKQYQATVSEAIAVDNRKRAVEAITNLSKFATDHTNKATVVAKAWKDYQSTGKAVQIIRDTAGNWVVNTGKLLNDKERQANGGVNVGKNSSALVEDINQEADALNKAEAALKQAVALKFNTQPVAASTTPAAQATASPTPTPAAPVVSATESAAPKADTAPAVEAAAKTAKAVEGRKEEKKTEPVQEKDVSTKREQEQEVKKEISELSAAEKMEIALLKNNPASIEEYLNDPDSTIGSLAQKALDAKEALDYHKGDPYGRGYVEKVLIERLTEDFENKVEFLVQAVHAVEKRKAPKAEAKRVDSAPSKEVTSPAPLIDRTDENSGSTLRPAETAEPVAAEAPEEVTAETETKQEEAVAPVLDVMITPSPEGAGYKQRNLVADFLIQKLDQSKPLTAVKDFMSRWIGKEVSMKEFVTEPKGGFKEAHFNVLRLFQTKTREWNQLFKENLAKRDGSQRDYWYNDMAQFFIQDTKQGLDLEENVKTAMSFAAFSWIAETASRGKFNTNEEINLILGREEDHEVSLEEQAALADIGTRQNVVLNALGQRAIQALGLKPSKDAPIDLMPRLESALGAHIMKMLLDKGILARTIIPASKMMEMLGKPFDEKNSNTEYQFVSLARTEGELNMEADQIVQASKGTNGILEKLFSVEAGIKFPTLEPVPFTQTKTKNTNQDIPEFLVQVMKEENAKPFYIRQDGLQVIGQLGKEILMEIAGAEHVEGLHITKVKSTEAKNDALGREIDHFNEYIQTLDDLTVPLYFEHSVWKQQRVGIATNGINPQSSKIHRHLLYRQSWQTKVEFDNESQMENFRLRVAEGLGIKTDKKSKEIALEEYKATVQKPVIKAAVVALRKAIYEGGISAQDQEAILAGVKAGGEKMHSLDALMALAHYAEAKAKGDASVTVELMGEVDGVTNGPMLSHLLLGAAGSVDALFQMLNKGGFYRTEDGFENYNVWRSAPQHFDLYETTAEHIVNVLKDMVGKDKRIQSTLDAIYAFTGQLVDDNNAVTKYGRNIVKTPLTSLVFGSAVQTSVDNMTNKFVEGIYDAIEKIDNDEQRVTLIKRLNVLGAGVNTSMTKEDLLNLEFKGKRLDNLKKAFKFTVGKATDTVLKQDFAEFNEQRQRVNQAAQVAFELYNAAYNTLRDQFIQEKIAAKEIEVDGKGNPIHELTSAQESELRSRVAKLAPVMHTAMSKQSGSLKAGLYMAKSNRALSQEKTFANEVKFGKPFRDNKAKSVNTHGYTRTQESPGVAMLVMGVHASDSAISHKGVKGNEVLNVHDAHGSGLANFHQTARNLNQATWETMLEYSPASEMFDALARTLTGIADLLNDPATPVELKANLAKALDKTAKKQEMTVQEVLALSLYNVKEAAFTADDMKLQAMSQMGAIDQYALEGGQYQVTEQDRAKAAEMRTQLSREIPEDLRAKLDMVIEAITGSKPDQELKATPVKAEEAASPFGKLGESRIESDPELVSLFNNKPSIPAKELLRVLMDRAAKADGKDRTKNFNLHLAGQLYKNTLFSDLTVNLVTSETKESDVIGKGEPGAMGWYHSNSQGQHAIYVLSPKFVNSGLTDELLLHELLHGVLARVIRSNSPEAAQLIQELETLRQAALDYVGKDSRFTEALVNVDEFISWGMTNKKFQDEVLANIKLESNTKGNALVSGMKAFIDTITSFFFPKKKDLLGNENNGMLVLVQNVAGLLEQANINSQPKDITLNQINTASYSTHELYDQLSGSVSSMFDRHLGGLLDGIVTKLHGPFGSFKEQFMATAAGTPEEIFFKSVLDDTAPFASKALGAGLAVNSKELFVIEQVEATVRAALEDNAVTARAAYRELSKLYEEARTKIQPKNFHKGDWNTATISEKEDAQAVYDFIFKMEANGNRTDHLSRFAAMGLGNEQFNQLLQIPTDSKMKSLADQHTFGDWLMAVFGNILEMFSTRITATFDGQRADSKLNALVEQLVDIEARRRDYLAKQASQKNYPGMVDEKLAEGIKAVTGKLEQFGKSAWFKNHKSGFVQAAGSMLATMLGGRQQLFMQGISDLRDKLNEGAPGILAGTFNYAKGYKDSLQELLRASKHRDKHTVHVKTQTSYFALGGFANEGNDLTTEQQEAITSVLVRTGAHNLLDKYSMEEISKMLVDRKQLDKAIYDEVAKLNQYAAYRHYYQYQAKVLGYYRATEKTKGSMMMLNAGNIAKLYGTPYAGKISEADAKGAEEILNVLVTLYGLSYADSVDVAEVSNLFSQENARTDGNGIQATLMLHKELEQQARERIFAGNEALMIHGYTPEITNPHIEVAVVDASERNTRLAQGYKEVGLLEKDPHDPEKTGKVLMVLHDGGKQPLLTGSMAYQGTKAKGTGKKDGFIDQMLIKDMTKNKQGSIANMFRPNPTFDPSRVAGVFASPVLNSKGELTNWRYMMNRRTRDTVLQRDNRFDKVLGQLAGSTYDKETVTENNVNVAKALHEIYQAEFSTNSTAFINVGPRSADPAMREIWRLIPDKTKMEIENIWGREGMQVRKDSLDIVFGYHKLSLGDMFDKLPGERSMAEKYFVMGAELVAEQMAMVWNTRRAHQGLPALDTKEFVKRVPLWIRMGERGWQEIVKETKDIIVVKTGLVLFGNIMSNLMLLKMNGVPLGDIIKDSIIAAKGAKAYHKDYAKLTQLQNQLDTGYVVGSTREVEREIVRLTDAIERNPVKKLIDAGLMPTIAEDIDPTNDSYSYKSALVRKTDKFVKQINPHVVDAAKAVYMAKDTTMYKALTESTQLSDFTGRYVMYNYLTTKAKKTLSHEAAVQEASEQFVNYDIPMPRKLQYSDDMGLTFFSKYFLSIQRVLTKLGQEHPGNVLATMLMTNYLVDLPTILDSSLLGRIGNNPFSMGAFNYPGTLDELATVNAGLSVFR